MSNRLQSEQARLFGHQSLGACEPLTPAAPMQSLDTRFAVLAVGRPAEWDLVQRVWLAVQAELSFPAPAIAVNGMDAYQLWFAFAEVLPVSDVFSFLNQLVRTYLADVDPARIRCIPSVHGPNNVSSEAMSHVPGLVAGASGWSAFVSADLARIFEEEPWLDRAPGDEAQADLLSRLQPMPVTVFQAAIHSLRPGQGAVELPERTNGTTDALPNDVARTPMSDDPRAFLLSVMNNPAVEMRVRVDAAKALLLHSG